MCRNGLEEKNTTYHTVQIVVPNSFSGNLRACHVFFFFFGVFQSSFTEKAFAYNF